MNGNGIKTGMKKLITVSLMAGLINFPAMAQGFVNLNFESAKIPAGTSPGAFVPWTNAMPGWIGYSGSPTYGTNHSDQSSGIRYNTISLGGGGIHIHDTNDTIPFPAIAGRYSVLLEGERAHGDYSLSIGQTGQIPLAARSLIFLGFILPGNVTFNGQTLSLIEVPSSPSYNTYTADISAYAGNVGELLFTASPNQYTMVDNIQFSATQIPEPVGLSFLTVGLFILGVKHRK